MIFLKKKYLIIIIALTLLTCLLVSCKPKTIKLALSLTEKIVYKVKPKAKGKSILNIAEEVVAEVKFYVYTSKAEVGGIYNQIDKNDLFQKNITKKAYEKYNTYYARLIPILLLSGNNQKNELEKFRKQNPDMNLDLIPDTLSFTVIDTFANTGKSYKIEARIGVSGIIKKLREKKVTPEQIESIEIISKSTQKEEGPNPQEKPKDPISIPGRPQVAKEMIKLLENIKNRYPKSAIKTFDNRIEVTIRNTPVILAKIRNGKIIGINRYPERGSIIDVFDRNFDGIPDK